MKRPVVNIGLVANMFVRQMHFFEIDATEPGHAHSFDHLTLLASGKLRVEANGETTDFVAPAMIYIQADTEHMLTALEENTVAYCVHGLRDTEQSDDIIAPDMVPTGVKLKNILNQIAVK
jgi:quercetin dioxygenase-like cupin family protein